MKVTIDRLGHLGAGISDTEDGPIFVAGGLPGEVVQGVLDGDRLVDIGIVTPSPHRVRPPCAHARTCGGCQLQHVADGLVTDWKADVVRSALAGRGLETEFRPTSTSPASSRRRATLSGRRTKSGVALGFHVRSSDQLVSVPGCKLLHPDLIGSFKGLEEIVRVAVSRSSEASITITQVLGGIDVLVTGGKPLDGGLRQTLAGIVEAHRFARLTWGEETVALRHQPHLKFGLATVPLPPGAFLQATAEGEKALLSSVRDALGAQKRIVDLFAGLGTFALPLAEDAALHAVEGDRDMTAALDSAVRRAEGLHPVTISTRDLFRRPLEPDEFKGVTGVVIDPPRAGAEQQTERLVRSGVPVIAAVSCSPVTFARDAQILVNGGYTLDWVQVVDQFRWSTHVELVARFSRSA